MSENEPDAISFRQDFPALDIPSEELIGYKRTMSEFNKTAKAHDEFLQFSHHPPVLP